MAICGVIYMGKGRKIYIFVKYELREKRHRLSGVGMCPSEKAIPALTVGGISTVLTERNTTLKASCEGLQQSLIMGDEIGQTSGITARKLCYQLGD